MRRDQLFHTSRQHFLIKALAISVATQAYFLAKLFIPSLKKGAIAGHLTPGPR